MTSDRYVVSIEGDLYGPFGTRQAAEEWLSVKASELSIAAGGATIVADILPLRDPGWSPPPASPGATRLTEQQLTALRADGIAQRGSITDPMVVRQCEDVLDRRGEAWAAAILGRDLSRRSSMRADRPFIRWGEEYTLVDADKAEDQAVLDELEGGDGAER